MCAMTLEVYYRYQSAYKGGGGGAEEDFPLE
jgi:hypothetical protein